MFFLELIKVLTYLNPHFLLLDMIVFEYLLVLWMSINIDGFIGVFISCSFLLFTTDVLVNSQYLFDLFH